MLESNNERIYLRVATRYLSKLQLIEHLEIDLLDEIPRKIDGADPGDGAEGTATHIIDLVIV